MHIAIFETVHFENIVPLLRLFDQRGNRITVFCEEVAWQQASIQLGTDAGRYEWVLQAPGMQRRQFLGVMRRHLHANPAQCLYLNTVSDNFWHLAWLVRSLKQTRVIVTLHAINSYFSPQLRFNLRRMARVTGKWLLRRTIREYAVQSTTLLPAARRNLDTRHPIHWIPGAVYPARTPLPSPAFPLHLVVPGSVDGRRRNYDEAMKLIGLLERSEFKTRVTFLGGTGSDYGRAMADRWRNLELQKVQLKWYETGLVPQEEYDRVLADAHFIYHPSANRAILEDGAEEIYGETVSSGVFSDAIRHAKPMLFPATLAADPVFLPCSLRYNMVDELVSFLQSIDQAPDSYANWLQAAHEMALHFTIDRIRQRNPALFGGPSVSGSTAGAAENSSG